MKIQLVFTLLLLLQQQQQTQYTDAFTPSIHSPRPASLRTRTTFLRSSATDETTSSAAVKDEINAMRAGAIKKELESMGISTKTFLEKTELVDALVNARKEGRSTVIKEDTSSSKTTTTTTTTEKDTSTATAASRAEKLTAEIEKCRAMKAGELRKELESMGISTKTFFEKSEFVKALAEARVDGIASQASGSNNNNSDEESYAEYSNVEVLTSDSAGPRPKQKEQQKQQQQQGGGNPFGGAGAGGMNLEDLMKNMGRGMGGGMPNIADMFGGAAGGNPFGGSAGGGGGGNPFGGGGGMPDMKKAQELMSNPKVRELMVKAQGNPKVMRVLQECMSNPAAFMKYQNDPEVSELIAELKKLM